MVMRFLLIGLSLTFSATPAQDKTLVKVSHFLSQDKIRPGDTFKVAFRVSVAPGYHINGNELTDSYLLPTELILEEQPGFKAEEYFFPAPRPGKFSFSENEFLVYEGDILLAVLIQAGKELPPGSQKLKGKLIYQACDSISCLPPSEIPLGVPLDVVPSSQEIKDINQDIFSNLEFKKEKKRAP